MKINLFLIATALSLATACTSSASSAHQATQNSAPSATPAPAPTAPPAQAQQMPKGSNVNPDAGLLAEFKAKVNAYDELRKDLQKKVPPLKKTDDPAEIALAEKALAQQIRAARANAKPGDIFTPATRAMFRRLLSPTVKGEDGADNKAAIKDDSPEPKDIPFKINGEYPKVEAMATMPPDVLKALPPLPEALQFRFVGKHMLLYCSRGNLIVDYMLNAIP
jgi:hypothetical protein